MTRLLLVFAAAYLFLMAFIYIFQRSLQYAPDRHVPGTPAANGVPQMQAVRIKTDDSLDLLAWFAPPREKDGKIVIYFHGNAGHIGARGNKVAYFTDKGWGFLFCEYRGYGGNPGQPSEQGFYRDGRAAIAWLEAQGYQPGQFVIYGESIGSGTAVQMALEIQTKWLILEAPFTSATEVAKLRYFWLPVDFLLHDKFDNIAKIGKINSSLLVVHGDADLTIPIRLSKKLYEAANHPKEYATVSDAGHGDLYDRGAGQIIVEWLERQ